MVRLLDKRHYNTTVVRENDNARYSYPDLCVLLSPCCIVDAINYIVDLVRRSGASGDSVARHMPR